MKRFKTYKRKSHKKFYLIIKILTFSFFIFKIDKLLLNDKFINLINDYYFNKIEAKEELVSLNIVDEKKPVIYIYNTHQKEEYIGGILDDYDVMPSVFLASKRLKENLMKLGIETIIEETNMEEELYNRGLNFNYSYRLSKELLLNKINEYPSLEYFIDLHRDAIPYDRSVITYLNKDYAKVLFVIGIDLPTYQDNAALAKTISDKLNQYVPGISRGIMYKNHGNGDYNLDVSSNALLIELGGEYNKFSEVNNTLGILATCYMEVINGK